MLNFYEGHKVYIDGKYPAIFLNGKNAHIHRLEWEKHFGKIPDGYVIHHKDENKLNYSIDNLELISRAEHVMKHFDNLHNENSRHFGEKSRHHKLTRKDIEEIKHVFIRYDKNYGCTALAKKYNVTASCISQIIRGKNWSGGDC